MHPDHPTLLEHHSPLFEEGEEIPFCLDCRISLRAAPISATEMFYFCRICHMGYTLSELDFGNRPLPPEFEHCRELKRAGHHKEKHYVE